MNLPAGNSIGSVSTTSHPYLRYIIDILSFQLERYRRVSTSDDKMQVDGPVSPFPDIGQPTSASKIPRDNDDSTSNVTYDCNGLSYLSPLSLMHDLVTQASHSPSPPPPSATESRTPTPPSQDPNGHSDQSSNQQVVPRSRWQSVLLEAGGIGAAVSEESMRRLKYCLQWLQVRTPRMLIWCTLLIICLSVRYGTNRLSDRDSPRLYRLPSILCC